MLEQDLQRSDNPRPAIAALQVVIDWEALQRGAFCNSHLPMRINCACGVQTTRLARALESSQISQVASLDTSRIKSIMAVNYVPLEEVWFQT